MKRTLLSGAAALLIGALLTPAAGSAAVPKEKVLEETMTYVGEHIELTVERWLYDFAKTDLRFFVVDVCIDSPKQLQTAFAGEAYSTNTVEPTSDIAARHEAVLAINGDFYNFWDKVGLVIRNGELYRDKEGDRDHLLIMDDGSLRALPMGEYEAGKGEAWLAEGVEQSFIFGPLLVVDGEATQLPKKYVINTKGSVREPRTGIGFVEENHYVLLVADGRRRDWSDEGMTLPEMQEVFLAHGCSVAYNLDGGGSSTLVLNGERINKTSGSRERNVSDIVYFVD